MKKLKFILLFLLCSFSFSCIPYKPEKQETISIDDPEERRRITDLRYSLDNKKENYFNVKNDKIFVYIPITENKLYIEQVVNVSSNNLNSIVIVLNGNQGDKTNGKPITGYIKSEILISKIKGLDIKKLEKHDSLKVFIIHDDAFKKDDLKKYFIECVKNDGTIYTDNICKGIPKKPREQEGDIITGG
jgi:hypothetical protein